MTAATSYTQGECTYGAALLAPWIPAGLGNADTWVSRAGGAGLSTGSTPRVGAAMVFNSSYPGSSGYGHVGIVQSIDAAGYPIITEMNATRDGGGFGKYDNYQTTPYDVGFLAGYIYPPGSSAANPSTSATLMDSSTVNPSAMNNPLNYLNIPFTPGYNPLLPPFFFNPASAVGASTSSNSGGIAGIMSGVVSFVTKAGEVFIGLGIVLVGIYLIAKDAGGPTVTNALGKVPGIGQVAGIIK